MRQNWDLGAVTTDHMFIMDYTEGKGWHDPRIIPYGPIELDPFLPNASTLWSGGV